MRLAVDTNILARAIADDGSEQASISRRCFVEHEIFMSNTVLLETEWLLRSRLKLPRNEINDVFSRLVLTEGVHFENLTRAEAAILAHASGMDFADAFHLLAARDCAAFATFDDDFIKRQKALPGAIPVRRP